MGEKEVKSNNAHHLSDSICMFLPHYKMIKFEVGWYLALFEHLRGLVNPVLGLVMVQHGPFVNRPMGNFTFTCQ